MNKLYNVLDKEERKKYIITLLILVALPSVINDYIEVIPEYWSDALYPLLFYYLGVHMKENEVKISGFKVIITYIVVVICTGFLIFSQNYNGEFTWSRWQAPNCFLNVISSSLLFTYLMNLNYSKVPNRIKTGIAYVAELCLGGYLLSFLMEEFIYPFYRGISSELLQVKHWLIIVFLIFVGSIALSLVANIIYKVIYNGIAWRRKNAKG